MHFEHTNNIEQQRQCICYYNIECSIGKGSNRGGEEEGESENGELLFCSKIPAVNKLLL